MSALRTNRQPRVKWLRFMRGIGVKDGGLSFALGTGEGAMKKLFAYAAIALVGIGALILATHSNAKSSGFAGKGFKGKSWAFAKPHIAPHLHAAHAHHFAHAHDFDRHHRHARRFDFGFPFAFDAPYAEPLIVEVPQETDDVTGSTAPRHVSVWRGYNRDGGCSAESVTVPASQGGDTTIRIIRC
jgi:hypothetical protein